ncbi:type IV pilus modification PilV family protein [Candidatus Ferrigenium straubiae]|jgi:type IV pilus assembly protein PilV|uniref:type IV pilus modification PilV family protein n=1 Tax=Candidatus Ferrigenium straubiae TaxID=2919506 RepID=UPI003F4ABA04
MRKAALKTMRSTQQGSVVLEALISILLFAIGILAIIGLQAASIKNVAAAKYRIDASLLVNQVIGQMWASDKTNATLVANFSSPAGASYATWANSVAQALPGVSGVAANAPTIAIDASNNATITVFWQAPNEAVAHNYTAIAVVNN